MNTIGLATLFGKEVRRFLKVPGQTLAQPVVMTSLYFLIFGYSLGSRIQQLEGVPAGMPYIRFIVPGLVMLALIQNAFLNSASSLFVAKIQGTIVDLLVAPLSVTELLLAFVGGAVVRGVLVGAIVWLVAGAFTGFEVAHAGWAIGFALLVSVTFGLLGMVVAIWSDKFEQLNIVPTFVITPLTFLGGVFYSVGSLPSPWSEIAHLNPVLYMVEGLRYGVLGHASFDPWLGFGVCAALCAVALATTAWMLHTGYKLRG